MQKLIFSTSGKWRCVLWKMSIENSIEIKRHPIHSHHFKLETERKRARSCIHKHIQHNRYIYYILIIAVMMMMIAFCCYFCYRYTFFLSVGRYGMECWNVPTYLCILYYAERQKAIDKRASNIQLQQYQDI